MNWYKYSVNIKAVLFLLGIVLIVFFVMFTQSIVDDLREDNRKIAQLYSEMIASVASEDNDESLNFIFENIIQKVSFPLIQSDSEMNPISWKNLPDNVSDEVSIFSFQQTMDKQNEPIPLIYNNKQTGDEHIIGYLHFGDSILINRLEMLPFIQICVVGLFILIGFTGFSVIRNSEKKHIWAGMARETAHQLGTPVSALMGWIDLLKNNPKDTYSVVKEIELDLKRLGAISDRFGDMSTKSKLKEFDLIDCIKQVLDYLERRVSEVVIDLKYEKSNQYNFVGNRRLLSWAIENIIKNGIDAVKDKKAKITISVTRNDTSFQINISDNGAGIPRRDWKNIFRPGFSTKKYGWGLGLSLANRIVIDIHRGKLFVKESFLGEGSTISIILR